MQVAPERMSVAKCVRDIVAHEGVIHYQILIFFIESRFVQGCDVFFTWLFPIFNYVRLLRFQLNSLFTVNSVLKRKLEYLNLPDHQLSFITGICAAS